MTDVEIKNAIKKANKLLSEHGFGFDGEPKKKLSKAQKVFEKRIIGTPMGNGSR